MSLTSRVLIGLVAGFLLGLAGPLLPFLPAVNAVLTPIGAIFINLIRMTVVPLVLSMLVASIGSIGASAALGRAGVRAVAIALALLTIGAAGSVAVAAPVFARVTIDRTTAAALAGAPGGPAGAPGTAPTVAQWFVDLVPPNVVKAAADGAMLPLIVFAVFLGLALAQVVDTRRAAALRVVEAVADAMQRIVGWILELAPIGVFALAVPLASRLGIAAAGAVAVYIVLVVALTVAFGALVLYPAGIAWGPLSASGFVTLCGPAQAVAFASRSSLASLPAMLESAERAGIPQVVTGFVLPVAATAFRSGAAIAQTVGVLFLASLYGVTLTAPQLASIAFTVILTTFAVPGIPGGSIIAMVPVLAAANLPIDGIGVLLAVDTIPDMFRTTANVTGSMTLAAMLAGRGRPAR